MRGVTKLILAVWMACFIIAGQAHAYENSYEKWEKKECRFARNGDWSNSEIRDLIRCAFGKLNASSQVPHALYVAERESGFQERAYNATGCNGSGCKGLFQHHAAYWPGNFAAYPVMKRRFDVRNPSAFDPRSNTFVTARMVGPNGHWGPWGG